MFKLDMNALRNAAKHSGYPANAANLANAANDGATTISQLAGLATLAGGFNHQSDELLTARLLAAIHRCCDARGDEPTDRAALLAACADLPPEQQADLLAHFSIEAVRWGAASGDTQTRAVRSMPSDGCIHSDASTQLPHNGGCA
jgi:hypothetical protein